MRPTRSLVPLAFTLLLAACGGPGPTPPATPTPPAAPAPPTTPPEDSAPVISSFTASPTNVVLGDFVTLSWSVTNAAEITLTPDPGQGDLSSETGVTVTPTVTTTYTLEAVSSSGLSSAASVTVTVDEGQLPGSTLPY